jgi:hypothetical protein
MGMAVFTAGLAPLRAQVVLSARAGLVHYVEGEVALVSAGKSSAVQNSANGRFTDMKDGDRLITSAEGRAEVLLNPGVFLRLGEDSEIRMISSRLSDVRVEVVKGNALVEATEVLKDNAVTILAGSAELTFDRMGLARINPRAGIRVYKGQASVTVAGATQVLKEGREMLFEGDYVVAKFDAKVGDPLYRWANRRAEYIGMANIAAAHMARKSGTYSTSGWFYNPYYGLVTFLPMGSTLYRSPFGYMFYSPSLVRRYYQSYMPAPSVPMGGGAGYGGQSSAWSSDHGYYINSGRSAVSSPSYNSGPVSAPSSGAAAAADVPAAGRGADAGVGRGGGGGRGQ